MENRMDISDAIRYIMESRKIADQYVMANELGVSQGTISNYAKGNQYPKLVIAARIYGKFGLFVEPFTDKAIIKEWEFRKQFKENL